MRAQQELYNKMVPPKEIPFDKLVEVVVVSGDRDQAGFEKTFNGDFAQWLAIPYGEKRAGVTKLVPCTGYPTPGILDGLSGKVIYADAWNMRNAASSGDELIEDWETHRDPEV